MIKIKDLSVGTPVSLFDGNDEVEFKFVSYDAESDMVVVRGEEAKPDKYAAMRRAIVRAVAR